MRTWPRPFFVDTRKLLYLPWITIGDSMIAIAAVASVLICSVAFIVAAAAQQREERARDLRVVAEIEKRARRLREKYPFDSDVSFARNAPPRHQAPLEEADEDIFEIEKVRTAA